MFLQKKQENQIKERFFKSGENPTMFFSYDESLVQVDFDVGFVMKIAQKVFILSLCGM